MRPRWRHLPDEDPVRDGDAHPVSVREANASKLDDLVVVVHGVCDGDVINAWPKLGVFALNFGGNNLRRKHRQNQTSHVSSNQLLKPEKSSIILETLLGLLPRSSICQ